MNPVCSSQQHQDDVEIDVISNNFLIKMLFIVLMHVVNQFQIFKGNEMFSRPIFTNIFVRYVVNK